MHNPVTSEPAVPKGHIYRRWNTVGTGTVLSVSKVRKTRAWLPTWKFHRPDQEKGQFGQNPHADRTAIRASNLLPEYREPDTVRSAGRVGIFCIRPLPSRNLYTRVRPLWGSDLLQRHDHPTDHHRNKPVEIQINQLSVGYYASRDDLTPSFHCQREMKEGD